MMEDDMKRNGSGYYDETPIKSGVLAAPQPGEIWEDTNGNLVLILKNQDGYCNVLAMRKSSHDDNIEICNEMGTFYVNPGMVRFLLSKDKGRYIYTIPLEKHLEIMEAVSERLGVTIRVSGSNGHNLEELTATGGLFYRDECARLECCIEEWVAKYNELKKHCDVLANHLEAAKEELYSVKAAGEKAYNDFHSAFTQVEEKATMYEKMYNALLDRLFARGEAK